MIDQIDMAVTRYVNGFARQWPAFDWLVLDVLQLPTVKLLPIVGCLVWLWFSGSENGRRRRMVLDATIGGFVALLVSRTVQNLSPHRPRPGLSPDFDFVQPVSGYVNDWSSFPSDTAALACALLAAIWLASRRLGLVALAWTVAVVCFPRLYGGFHYLSDLLAGGAIGAAATLLVAYRLPGGERLFGTVVDLSRRHRALFYTVAFFLAFQVATYFTDPRQVLSGALAEIGALRNPQ